MYTPRHPSKLPQFLLAGQLISYSISNLVLLVLSLVAMSKAKGQPDAHFPDWAVYNYTASAAGVGTIVLITTFITALSRYRRRVGPSAFITPRYVRRCTLYTTAVHALALLMVFHEAYAWEQIAPGEKHQIPWSLLSIKNVITHPMGAFVFKTTGLTIVTGVLFTGFSLALEEPCVREYPGNEPATRTPSTVQVI
ncbi:unnamed protein product [Clonostachys rosea]|uniref:Ferric oxidoreductase domain-containing protein n=1 Tax=Bionectria ochroleuca TaxID=29856 RepID=A0ABY6UCX5_BIOOC|nr:unnamed protein product [Clonostachys rosea]